eukprot:192927_1
MSEEELKQFKEDTNNTTCSNDETQTLHTQSPTNTSCKERCRCQAGCFVATGFIIIGIIMVFVLVFVVYALTSRPWENTPTKPIVVGLSGEWPCHGGNSKRQQIANLHTTLIDSSVINAFNNSLYTTCNITAGIYEMPWRGYVTIDDNNHGYFTSDYGANEGYITCFDLNTCKVIWRVSIVETLKKDANYNNTDAVRTYQWGMRQTVTLFTNSKGENAVLVGTPNKGNLFAGGNENKFLCMAFAFKAENGELLWKTELSEGIGDRGCNAHGFMVQKDSKYAYGGLSYSRPPLKSTFRGRMFKIDIDTGTIVNTWWSIPRNKTDYSMSTNYTYLGAACWFFPTIIDQYLVFGTGNVYAAPKYIDRCLAGNFSAFPIENSYHVNACGENMSDNVWWRCLEKDIYTDSLMVLDKNNFHMFGAKPLQGIDSWNGPFCYLDELRPPCLVKPGPDGDVSVVVTYVDHKNGQLYAAAAQKTGHFYVFEIPSTKVIIAKKLSPASTWGGGRYGLAVDEINMIAIVSITGGGYYYRGDAYRYYLADGTLLCSVTGSTHAIDLKTGNTIWQVTTPYGHINEYNSTECNEHTENYVDIAINQSCILQNDSYNVINNNINVVIPPKTLDEDMRYNVTYDTWD